jgi:putative addiction module killer protein
MVDNLSPLVYTILVFELRQSALFADWLTSLRDSRARARIVERIRRASLGNLGDAKSVGERVSELRVDYRLGYRVYLVRRPGEIIVLLFGGDKSSQAETWSARRRSRGRLEHGDRYDAV